LTKVETAQFAALAVQYETVDMHTKIWLFERHLTPVENRNLQAVEIDLDGEFALLYPDGSQSSLRQRSEHRSFERHVCRRV
jgi:hypothetical protein